MINMIFEKSFSISKKNLFFLHFSKPSFLGIFLILAKNTPKLQNLFKKWPKSSIYLIIEKKKNPLFTVDLFSRIYDKESPICLKQSSISC